MKRDSGRKYFDSEEQLMEIINFLPDATMAINREGKVIIWNRAMEELTGIKSADMLGKDDYEYSLPFYGERRPVLADLVLTKHGDIIKKYPALKKKGDALYGETYVPGVREGGAWLWGIAKPLYGSDGEITGAIESIRDITDLHETSALMEKQKEELQAVNDELTSAMESLKRANSDLLDTRGELLKTNELLQYSEEKFSKAFKGSPMVISLSTLADGRYIDVSDSFYEETGYSRDEVIGHTAFDLDIWADTSDRDRIISGMKEKGRVRELEIRFRRKGGNIRTKLFSADIVTIAGEPCMIAINADITERKRNEEIIRKQKVELESVNRELVEANELLLLSEEKFAKTVHLGPVIITLTSLDDGKYVEVSDYFLRLTGYSREEVIGHTSIELNIWADSSDRENVIELLKRDGVVREHEIKFSSREGEIYIMRYSAEVITVAGVPHLVSVAVDITERRRAEEEKRKIEQQLAHSQKMETVGRLAGGIAHDFNNLLTAIMGNVELAMLKLGEESPAYPNLETVKKASESAADLTGRILTFSRKQEIEQKVVDLNEMIEHMRRMLERLIGEDIELKTVPGAGEALILADPGHIEQILVNLSVNARDAMPDGGALTLETGSVSLDEHYCREHAYALPGDYVMLSVNDTGTGMSDQVKEHLFEPFFTTKPAGKGTGLGLSMVYGAVKQNRGTIEVYSVEGTGTSFKIYFPVASERAGEGFETCGDDAANGGCETVLLVEDSPLVLDFAVTVLEQAGYNVINASTGEDALEKCGFQGGGIDLLITDVILPGINGKNLADEIQKGKPEVKVIFTSGYTGDFVASREIGRGGINFIGKPYSSHSLLKKVREVLDGHLPPESRKL